VFDFANDPYYTQETDGPDDICATAAQEIAHTWALDHVIDATDPMTYNLATGIRQYKDNQKCGSDCQNGHAPLFTSLACTGSGGQATHTCALGGATQNEVQVITALFGSSAPDTTPPVVTITAPTVNASVMPGFSITATVTDNQLVASAEAKLDGTSLGVKTSTPFSWVAPQSLAMGSHHIEVIGTDGKGNTTSATVDVSYGSSCTQNSDCPDSTQVCDHSICVAGPTATGGLGSPCTGNSDCASGSCGNDGTTQYCVSSCDPAASTCPSGFQCDDTGGGAGVCWPGESGGGGGCSTSGSGSAPLILFGLGALFLVRRRRA
jgi:MYXO-CTERM domain-containing protein